MIQLLHGRVIAEAWYTYGQPELTASSQYDIRGRMDPFFSGGIFDT